MKRKMISLLLTIFFVMNTICPASGTEITGAAAAETAGTGKAAETLETLTEAGTEKEAAENPEAAGTAKAAEEIAEEAGTETAAETAEADRIAEEEQEGKAGNELETVPYWSNDSPALQEIFSLVSAMTEESSDEYLPQEDRIAVFDFDGTLFGERFPTYFDNCLFLYRVLDDDSFKAPADIEKYAVALRKSLQNGTEEPEAPRSTAQMTAECFAGMTVEDYRKYVREFMAEPAWGFENLTYGSGYFQPMVSLVKYLAGKGFKIFVSSGSERTMVRELMAGTLDEWIPSERVIGSTFSLTAAGQGNTAGRSYSFSPDDKVLMEGNLVTKNQKTNKVFSIVDEIGKVPVLVFGNSTGDLSMAQYSAQNGGHAFMLLCDDLERDYGDLKTAESFKKTCQESGFWTISMKDEFATIYGDDVIKIDEMAMVDRVSEIRERGKLLVGATGDYRPMSYREPDSGEYWGFDAELAKDLADSLGVELQYVPTSWPTLMDDTLAGKFDLAVCGITVTDERKEQALMSDGYLGNGKTIICRSEDAGKYTDLASINKPEVRVMVNPGGLNEKFAKDNLPEASLIIHDINQDIPGLIAEGRADIMITEIMEAGYYVGQDKRLAAPLINEPFTKGQLGILMPKESEDLLEYVNEFLEKERISGRLDELADKYIYLHQEEELAPAA